MGEEMRELLDKNGKRKKKTRKEERYEITGSDGCKFGILKEVKMTAACSFISLGEEMRELLDKNGKRKKKEKRKITDHIIEQKSAKFARCVAVYYSEAE